MTSEELGNKLRQRLAMNERNRILAITDSEPRTNTTESEPR